MKIPLLIKCSQCKKNNYVFILLDEMNIRTNCECGNDLSGFLDNSFTTGLKLLHRSRYEYLENKDYSMTIVFAASALECDISRLYFKWKDIENIRYPIMISDEELEKDLRKFYSIDIKIEQVAKLMYPNGIMNFIKNNAELSEIISKGFHKITISSFSKDIRNELFWKRNRILHLGETKYKEEDAKYCYTYAQLGIRVFEELDNYKINAI